MAASPDKPFPVTRSVIESAIRLPGFERWRSPLDSTSLNRPPQRPENLPGKGRQAAVVALLYPVSQKVQISVIRRHHRLRHHAGQLALAGGRQEPGETLRQTAIRETAEELGVSLDDNDLLGSLRPIYIPPSDFTLLPFVAWLDERPTFTLCDQEVDELIEIPLAALIDVGSQQVRQVRSGSGELIEVPCYIYRQQIIWGATALVISELVERIRRAVL